MGVDQTKPIDRWWPRFSLLTSFLLLTIAGMAIVVVRLWREVSPLRAEVWQLRDETGRLSIDDPTRIHAIEVRTSEPLLWKFRVWVPEGEKAIVRSRWGGVPRVGVPEAQAGLHLVPGEQWITYRVKHSPSQNAWQAWLESPTGTSAEEIPEVERWWQWPRGAAIWGEGVQHSTAVFEDHQDAFVLKRWRVADTNNSSDIRKMETSAGFIIWLERE
jgi:hypothetical protein